MNVIFLDCDGVLNNPNTTVYTESGYIGVDPYNFCLFIDFVKDYKASIVLTSTWQNDKRMLGYLIKELKKHHISLKDVTHENTAYRGRGIKNYLNHHKSITHYVIFDDIEFPDFKDEGLLEHFVLVDYEKGLLEKDIEKAKYIMKEM